MSATPPLLVTGALRSRPARLRRAARRLLQVLGLGVFVALCLTLVMRQSFGSTLVYSLSISFFCWLFIDGGRVLAARYVHRRAPSAETANQWPGWPWMSAVLLVGTPLGYAVGTALANRLTGAHDPGLVAPLREVARVLVISLVPGAFACFYFYSRERLAAVQRLAAENQLRLLQSQLEPHMLFNTLANLRVLIGLEPARAQAMLDRLIAFLRATLEASRGQDAHALAAEMARIADYLALMQVRMGPRLATRLELPPALAALPVPPLLLQPLVENAIRHGLEPKVEGGLIEVTAACDGAGDGARLRLVVRDTGVGLGAARAHGTPGTRFGLQQVRERLAALYGAEASLELVEAPDGAGTLATIRLPWPKADAGGER